MRSRSDGRVSLLGSPSKEGPPKEEWRADALARSPHTRFVDLEPPKEDFDEERARLVCASITRDLLQDFAPALFFLPHHERLRVQTLVAYTRTLFDFASQGGMEGERLSEINRWEFALEAALGGQPIGQPIFVRLAREEEQRPWPREPFDELGRLARRRASVGAGEALDDHSEDRRRLAETLVLALLDGQPCRGLVDLGAALLELRELPEDSSTQRHAELDRRLEATRGSLRDLPRPYARLAGYLYLAGRRLCSPGAAGAPLGLGARIACLLRARWSFG